MDNVVFPVLSITDNNLPFYITGAGHCYTQGHIVRKMGYPSFVWMQVAQGTGEVKLEYQTYTLGEGTGILLFPSSPHEYYPTSGTWILDWIAFEGHQVEHFLTRMGLRKSEVYLLEDANLLSLRIKEVLQTALSDDLLKSLKCSGMLYVLLLDVIKNISSSDQSTMGQMAFRLKPVLDYIDNRYMHPVTLDDLASVIRISPEYLCILFKQATHFRPMEYVNHVRIQRSKQLLAQPNHLTIKEIARLCGYESASYYCMQFKKLEHMTPLEFKKMYKGA